MTAHALALAPVALVASAGVPGLDEVSFFMGGLIVLLAVLFHCLPQVTRQDIFFSVTVDPAFRASDEARRIVRQFRAAIWTVAAIALAIDVAGAATQNEWAPQTGVFLQVLCMFPAFLRARKQARAHAVAAATQREATLAPRSKGGIAFVLLQLGPFAILAACALYLKANWQRIPERFPVHWGTNGEPNGWSTRSISGVYGPLFMALVLCVLLASFSYAIKVWTRHIWASGPRAQAESRFRHAQVGLLLLVQYFLVATLAGVPFLAPRPDVARMPSPMSVIAGTFVFILAIIAVLIYTGQGGARLAKSAVATASGATSAPVGDRTPDQCWKAGMFYVNPDDPAVFVEKRFGIGYTLNFARPAAWLLMGAVLAVALVTVVMGLLSSHSH